MTATTGFAPINRGYDATFRAGQLSLGLVTQIEHYADGPVPTMHRHLQRAERAEALGFAALWLRDVPFDVPSFGDAGQIFDPFVYLGLLAGRTETIGLGVASVVLATRHPADVAKAAASVDVLSGGRLILGVASGDRPEEYPAMNLPFAARGAGFRDAFGYIRRMAETRPAFENPFGTLSGGLDMLPKPAGGRLPLLVTGSSQQAPEWIAAHGDGWMTYPRGPAAQAQAIRACRAGLAQAGRGDRPVMQPLHVDLVADAGAAPSPIHLGLRTGASALVAYLRAAREIGVNHVALYLRFNRADIEPTLQRIADEVLPEVAA